MSTPDVDASTLTRTELIAWGEWADEQDEQSELGQVLYRAAERELERAELEARVAALEAALTKIEFYPVDVMSTPQADLLAVKEIAREGRVSQ